jgi:uncharacterized protein
MPGLPQGKPAGMACPHLDEQLRCSLFEKPQRPAVCAALRPNLEMCGPDRDHALRYLAHLEQATAPEFTINAFKSIQSIPNIRVN